MIKNITTIFAVALLTVSCGSVSRVQTRSLPAANPTSYSFPLPLDDVRTKALQAFSIHHLVEEPVFDRSAPMNSAFAMRYKYIDFHDILAAECSTNAIFSEAIFQDPANANDIYLHNFHLPLVVSSVYYGRHGGLPFEAAFHLHLASRGSNTLVTITALDAEVTTGDKFGFGPCGPGYGWTYKQVNPTTVEEYSVLRYLGRYLGTTNMPDVILPTQ